MVGKIYPHEVSSMESGWVPGTKEDLHSAHRQNKS